MGRMDFAYKGANVLEDSARLQVRKHFVFTTLAINFKPLHLLYAARCKEGGDGN